MFSPSQVITIILGSIVALTFLFYLSVKSLFRSAQESHEKYYIAIRDYIERNEENFASILDVLAAEDIELD